MRAIDTGELFHEAKFIKHIGFHNYATFIKEEIDKFYLFKTKNVDPERFLGKEDEIDDYTGSKLYFELCD